MSLSYKPKQDVELKEEIVECEANTLEVSDESGEEWYDDIDKKSSYAAVISWKTQLKTGTVIMMILMLKVLISVTSQVQTGLQRTRILATKAGHLFLTAV